MKRQIILSSFLLAGGAFAQQVPQVTPQGRIQVGALNTPKLTSVGQELLWLSGDQNLTLTVPTRQLVMIEVTSPSLDPSDYRSPDEYGDEKYRAAPSVTTYTLSADGKPVVARSYPEGPHGKDMLLMQMLDAGTYQLKVSTTGKGKNTFGLTVRGGTLSAQTVNITVLSHQWATIAQFLPSPSAADMTLYDTDGPGELELQLVSAGQRRSVALPTTGDLDSVQVTVPASEFGSLLQARIPEKARQHSNTIGITTPEEVTITALPEVPEQTAPTPSAEVDNIPTEEVTATVPPAPTPEPTPYTPPVVVVRPSVTLTQRESTIKLHFDTDAEGDMVVSQRLPEGAQLIAGSVLVDGQAGAGAFKLSQDGRTLFFTVSSKVKLIQFRVAHESPLAPLDKPALAHLGEKLDTIAGQITESDYRAARNERAATQVRNEGLIRAPLPGATIGQSERVEIEYSGPTFPVVKVNGVVLPEKLLGKKVWNDQGGKLTYYAVPFQSGKNVIEAGNDRIEVVVPGAPERVLFTPERLSGDGKESSIIKVQVVDKDGLVTPVPSLTLNIEGAQPSTPDALPMQPGFQLALDRGEGELVLQPQPGGRVKLAAWQLSGQAEYRLPNRAAGLAVANGSVTVPLSNLQEYNLDGRFAIETPVADGVVRAVGDSQGVQTLSDVQTPRQIITGDAGKVQQPLTAKGKVAAEYDSPNLQARYARQAATNPLTQVTNDTDGLKVTATRDAFSLIGTYEALPLATELRQKISTDSLIQLDSDVQAGSETVTLQGVKGGVSTSRTLNRGVDYTINYLSGLVVLQSSPALFDPEIRDARIQITYLKVGDQPQQGKAWSVAGRYQFGKFLAQGPVSGGEVVAGVMNDGSGLTYGARAVYDAPNAGVRLLGLYNNGSRIQMEAKGSWEQERIKAALNVQQQSEGYAGPLKGTPGLSARLEARQEVSDHFAVKGAVNYGRNLLESDTTTDQYRAELLGEYFTNDYMLALGAGYGDVTKTQVIAEVGSNGRFGAKIRHAQSLNGGPSSTTLSVSAPLNDRLTLKAEDRIEWGDGGAQQVGTIGVTGKFGVAQYDVTYELPNAAGDVGRTRTGVRAEWPINDKLAFGARAEVLLSKPVSGLVGAELRYNDKKLLALIGSEVAYLPEQKWSVALRSNLTYAQDEWTLSETGQSLWREDNQGGHKYAFGTAYRGQRLSVLGTVRYETGAIALIPGFSAQGDVNYSAKDTELKAGLGYQNNTYYGYVGANQWITDRIGVGARYGVVSSGGQASQFVGVEGTVVPVGGFGLSLGYNYSPLSGPYTPVNLRQGFYVRADALLRQGGK